MGKLVNGQFVFTSMEDLLVSITKGNDELSNIMVKSIVDNYKEKGEIFVIEAYVEDREDEIIDIMIEYEDRISILKSHLPTFERNEEFEKCQRIVEIIEYLEDEDK